jgi:hypothetical protein
MKTLILALALIAPIASSFALSEPVAAPMAQAFAAKTPPLQVVVKVPPSLRPIRDDDIADIFASRVVTALRQQGYQAPIAYIGPAQEPAKDQPLLEVNLIEWKRDRVGGFVNCTFSAALETPLGTKDLGLFSGTGISMLSRMDPFTRFEPFDQAARDAAKELYQRVMATNLLHAAQKASM